MSREVKAIGLRQIRSFVVLAEELHFGKAAQRLDLAQPSLTRQVKLLERQLGVVLFERNHRHVHLTPAGQVFLEQARVTLEQHDRSIEAAQNIAEKHTDVLTIGFEPCAAFHGIPHVIQEFGRRYPNLKLIIHQMKASDQEEALRRGRIDAGFLHPPISDNKLVFEKVMEERFVAVLPKTHRLAQHKKIELRDLATDPFILFPRKHAPGCFDVIQNLCRAAGFTPRTRHEAAEMTLCLNLIASGSGVTLAPACTRDWNVSGVVYRDLTGSGGTVESGFVRRAGELGTSLKQFLRLWQTDLAPRTPRRKT